MGSARGCAFGKVVAPSTGGAGGNGGTGGNGGAGYVPAYRDGFFQDSVRIRPVDSSDSWHVETVWSGAMATPYDYFKIDGVDVRDKMADGGGGLGQGDITKEFGIGISVSSSGYITYYTNSSTPHYIELQMHQVGKLSLEQQHDLHIKVIEGLCEQPNDRALAFWLREAN